MAEEIKDPLLSSCRAVLRLPPDSSMYDEEITDLIAAARAALVAGGVASDKAASSDDASVRVAIKTYIKANFGLDNPEADRLMGAFREMLCRMAGSSEHGVLGGNT